MHIAPILSIVLILETQCSHSFVTKDRKPDSRARVTIRQVSSAKLARSFVILAMFDARKKIQFRRRNIILEPGKFRVVGRCRDSGLVAHFAVTPPLPFRAKTNESA